VLVFNGGPGFNRGWATLNVRAINSEDLLSAPPKRPVDPACRCVTLSAAYDQAVTMSFRTVDGTAKTSDNDYIARTDTLTFAPGETTKTITIEVRGDNKNEADETFYLDLFDGSSNSLFTKYRGIGTILNDD
jgi:Calx-beta domain